MQLAFLGSGFFVGKSDHPTQFGFFRLRMESRRTLLVAYLRNCLTIVSFRLLNVGRQLNDGSLSVMMAVGIM